MCVVVGILWRDPPEIAGIDIGLTRPEFFPSNEILPIQPHAAPQRSLPNPTVGDLVGGVPYGVHCGILLTFFNHAKSFSFRERYNI